MKIIVSPTKKMKLDSFHIAEYRNPLLLDKTKIIYDILKDLSKEELKKLFKSNDEIALTNYQRLKTMDINTGVCEALYSYDGLAFKNMHLNILTKDEIKYLDEHLRIISAFYGILRPLDYINSYRLEMASKLNINNLSLYEFWKDDISKCLEDDIIINLASLEYSSVLDSSLKNKMINIHFKELVNNKYIEKGTNSKIARGAFVYFMAVNKINDIAKLKEFNDLGYKYNKDLSDNLNIVFIK